MSPLPVPDVGDPIPPIVRHGDVETWMRFAAVNHEIAAHHFDDAVAQHEGFPAAFAMAPLTFSYIQTMLRAWVGERGRLVDVQIRLRSPFLRDRVLTATGTVTARTPAVDGEVFVTAQLWADDDHGTRLVEGTAVVAFDAH